MANKNELNAIEANPRSSLEPAESPGLESSGSGPSPDPSSGRLRNAKGHREDCTCQVCARIQAAIAAGKLPKAQLREQARARTEAKKKAKAEDLSRRQLLRREEQKRKEAVVSAVLLAQAQGGVKPSLKTAAEIAGVSAPTAKKIAGEGFVETSLSRAGVTNDRLAQLASEGIDAMIQRIVTDRDGNIIDVINTPDWKNRHAFWADLLRIKKILGADAENSSGGGGLIIITPDTAKVLPGHAPTCTCDGCLRAWEDKTAHLRRAAMKERALLESTVNSERQDSRQDPRAKNAIDADVIDAIDVDAEEVEEVETDDFGPVVG